MFYIFQQSAISRYYFHLYIFSGRFCFFCLFEQNVIGKDGLYTLLSGGVSNRQNLSRGHDLWTGGMKDGGLVAKYPQMFFSHVIYTLRKAIVEYKAAIKGTK